MMMMKDESELLLPVNKSEQKDTNSHKLKTGLAVLAVLVVGAVGSVFRSSSNNNTEDVQTNLVAVEQKKVFEILGTDESKFNFYCPDMTYAFCGHATCYEIDDMTSACGCKMITKEEGKFSVDGASLVLVNSATFRKVVLLVN
jgi:hypothetical protein